MILYGLCGKIGGGVTMAVAMLGSLIGFWSAIISLFVPNITEIETIFVYIIVSLSAIALRLALLGFEDTGYNSALRE